MQIKNFGERLSFYRQNKKMTQEELSLKIGVTPQAISKWERGLGLPDPCILSDICRILNISADEMLQTNYSPVSEKNDIKEQKEVFQNLDISEPLTLTIGYGLISSVAEGLKTNQIHQMRLFLARDGILLPVIHIKDVADLKTNEYAILSYQRILYQEELETIDTKSFSKIMDKISALIRNYKNYAYILNRDMVKMIIEHTSTIYPVLISETIPSRISYGYLTRVLKKLLFDGINIRNINKIIEAIDTRLSENLLYEELIKQIEEELYQNSP